MLKNHELVQDYDFTHIRYERRPLRKPNGETVEGLFNAWIVMDNPSQLNSYTTDAVKERLKANTQEAADRGAFGAPTFFVGDDLFFGQDRLEFVEAALSA